MRQNNFVVGEMLPEPERQKWLKWLKRNWETMESWLCILLFFASVMVDALAGFYGVVIVCSVIAMNYIPLAIFRRWTKGMTRLILQLGSEDRRNREKAERELREIGKDAVPLLQRVFHLPSRCLFGKWDGNKARVFAAIELGRLKAREAVPDLLEGLDEPELNLKAYICWALGEIGDAQVIPKIIPLLGNFGFAYIQIPQKAGD